MTRRSLFPLISTLCFAVAVDAHGHDHGPVEVRFIENQGQWEGPFQYKATVMGATAFLEKNGITWVKLQEDADEIIHDAAQLPLEERESIQLAGHAWRMRFEGGAADPMVTATDPAPFTHNYFLGSDQATWRSNVPLMGTITYHEVWPGVDVVIKGTPNGNLKYDLHLQPGADASLIKFTFEGLDDVTVSDEGELILTTSVGMVKELAPVAHYADDDSPVSCAFQYHNGILQFALGEYDASRPLVIDPELIAATYSGAVGPSNYGHCASYDDDGNIYTGARAFGQGYPVTLGAFQGTFGGGSVDISLSKLSPDGSTLLYATYLGGAGSEYPHSLIVNGQGQLCVLGSTTSTDFPVTPGAIQTTNGGGTDMTISVLTIDGTALQGSTYLGGAQADGSNAMSANYGEAYRGEIMVDDADNILVASFSRSADFPVTPTAYQTTLGGLQDAVVVSLNNTCSELLWSTFLGGTENDGAFGIRVQNGDVYVCGQTFSTDFPTTPGAYQTSTQGGQDGFVVRLSNNGSQLSSSTYFGTTSADRPYFLDTDSDDNIWIYGQSVGPIPIQPAGIYGDPGGTIFLAKFDPDLSDVLVSTKIGPGSSPVMTPVAFLVDRCDKIYVSGYGAAWSDLPVSQDALYSSGQFYLAAFDVDMADMVFATYYGGNHVDGGTSRFDKNGIVYQGVCSSGNSMQTTPGAYAVTQAPAWDIGVFKIDFQVAGVNAAGASPVNQGCAPIEIQFSNSSTGTDWLWDFGDGSPPVADFEPAHLYTEPGSYTITLIASDDMSCNLADTVTFQIDIGVAEPYVASFTTDQDPNCSASEVEFTNTSTGSLLEFLWDMGDGTQYTDTNVVHTYTDPGSYEVQLNILDPSGCSQPDSTTQSIQVVFDMEVVEAIADIVAPEPCGDMTVITTNNSTGVAPTYQWDMGDGTMLTDAAVQHTYGGPGEYTILFIATDPATCNGADTLSWDIVIEAAPQADLEFEAELEQLCNSGIVQTANQSNGPTLEYHWNMGDGTEYDAFEVTHTYQEPGLYMIALSATDPGGCMDPMPYYVTIYVAEPEPINAGFSAEFETTCEGTMLTAVNYSGGQDLAYLWSFGDGNTSTEMDVEHLYVTSGEMILELIVQDLNGCVPNDTLQQVVDVPGPPLIEASFDHELLDNCDGGQFIGQALNVGTAELIWNMGEGTVLEGNYADHQYTEAGEYEVMLVAVDPGGCGSDTASVTVEVVLPEPMQLSFDLEEVYQCGETTVNCVSTSPGDLVFIWWTSDDVSFYGPEMEHTFTEPGTYEIRFYGLDPLGCVAPDSLVVTVVVDPVEPVTAEFDLLADMDCNGTTVQAGTTNTSPDLTYAWVMGDGSTYTDPEVNHLYDTPGSYSLQLTVTDNSGCNDPMTWSEDIEVQAPPYLVAGFEMESVQTCGSLDVMLMNTSAGQPVEMIWDMGNGEEFTGEAVAYTYEEPGTYTITLTINDPASCNLTDTESTTVTIDPLPVHEAAFELDQQAGCGELQIMATNTSVGDDADFLWIMGDGTTMSTPDASHLYTVGGNYTILLIVSDPAGCVPADTATAEVVVPESVPVSVDMAVEQIGGCESLQIEGTNMSAGSSWQWLWSMGDGTQYDSFEITHTYASPGTYTVSLIANDTLCGQQDMQVVTVSVTDGVPVVLLSSPVLCSGGSVVLDASATPGIYTWSNGSTDHSITVDVPGTYSVTVDGVDGCSGTASVFVPPGQQFEFEETIQACPDKMVPLSVPMEGVAYAWSTGGMQQNEHVRGPGTYTFVVTDDHGCQHTGSYTVEALDAEAQLYAPNAFTPDGDGINDEFTIYGYGEEASRMAIYNRWGQLLYETTANPPTWDGMYNGSIVKQDVYVYQLEYRSVCTNAVVSTTGHVTVVK